MLKENLVKTYIMESSQIILNYVNDAIDFTLIILTLTIIIVIYLLLY